MIRTRLTHPWLTVRCQIALGLLFMVAAYPKLIDPPGFAKALWAYQLFPGWTLHPIALILPWLEALSGACLCLGLCVRAATLWIGTLLAAFILALSINLVRRHPVDCGCFSTSVTQKTAEERLQDMRWTILRDLGMLLLAAQILLAARKPREMPGTPRR